MGPQNKGLFNRITLGSYEMGSGLKILNTALYLESGAGDIFTKLMSLLLCR